MKKGLAAQAKAFVRSRTALGKPRHGDKSGLLHSIRTSQERSRALVRAVEFIKNEYEITRLKDITEEMAKAYLESRFEEVGQKSLDNERLALQMLDRPGFAMEGAKLERIKTEHAIPRYAEGRAYTPEQIDMIAKQQLEHNALATRIAHAAGLRQHELYTLRPASERDLPERKWSNDRFAGRTGELYTVTGKGGLIRHVLIPTNLAEQLEQQRLQQAVLRVDQGVRYYQHYNIGAGRAWASSFRAAAERSIGWHKGAHGVRHAYAQERMQELQKQGFSYKKALGIVSQELGHFRPDITKVYLR